MPCAVPTLRTLPPLYCFAGPHLLLAPVRVLQKHPRRGIRATHATLASAGFFALGLEPRPIIEDTAAT